MKFLIDMNLSPSWVEYLGEAGHDAIHWSTVGRCDADDSEIMAWALDREHVVLTADLDLSAILVLSGSSKPSVVQLRSEATLPDRIGQIVLDAVGQAEQELLAGAILTVDVGRARLRVLPFDPRQ